MPKFYESTDKSVSIQFQVVRAYITPEDVMADHGIFANFSAKTVLCKKGQLDVPLMTHNSLTISVNRENKPFVGSKGEDVPSGQRIFFFSLFPGVTLSNNEKEIKRSEDFIQELIVEIQAFVKMARARAETQERDRSANVPQALKDLQKLSLKKDPPKGAKTPEDIKL